MDRVYVSFENLLYKGTSSKKDILNVLRYFIPDFPEKNICYITPSQLKQIDLNYPAIINIDDKPDEAPWGIHWCAFYKNNYFDPLGLPAPKNVEKILKKYNYNPYKIQKFEENYCGLYCVLFVVCMQAGLTMKEFISLFYKNNNIETAQDLLLICFDKINIS